MSWRPSPTRETGTVVLGVDDKTRTVTGIPLDSLDAVEAWTREICNDSVQPALDADIYKLELQGTDGRAVPVIRIEMSRSLFVHRSPGGYFRRLGSSKREMAPEILARLFQERSQSRTIRFDESVVPGTTPGDLDYALTRRFLREERTEEGVTEDAAHKLRVVADIFVLTEAPGFQGGSSLGWTSCLSCGTSLLHRGCIGAGTGWSFRR